MSNYSKIGALPINFRDEHKQLFAAGITTWIELKGLKDNKINQLVKEGRSTTVNLKRLRGIAELVCEIELTPQDAALLMHSGLATVSSLSTATPQEIVTKAGRFERKLKNSQNQLVDLAKANDWITKAKARQKMNWPLTEEESSLEH